MHPQLSEIVVAPYIAILDAMRVLDETQGKILFVADDSVLLGVLTDGDIRRHILSGGGLSERVDAAINRAPVVVLSTMSDDEAREVMQERAVHCMPVVDEDGRVIDAVWWADLFGGSGLPRRPANVPVVLMAGGKGSRLEPFTRILPKPLMPVGEQPVLQLIMDRLYDQGCSRFLVSLNFKASLIRAYFSDEVLPYPVEFFQETEPLGTAGSLALMSESLDGTFILANCDTILDIEFAKLVEQHRAERNIITIVASIKHVVLPYGVCEIGSEGQLEGLKEKPRFDLLASTGVYVMEPQALEHLSTSGPTDATDLIARVMEAGGRVGVHPIPESCWLDVGQLEELQHALDRLGIR